MGRRSRVCEAHVCEQSCSILLFVIKRKVSYHRRWWLRRFSIYKQVLILGNRVFIFKVFRLLGLVIPRALCLWISWKSPRENKKKELSPTDLSVLYSALLKTSSTFHLKPLFSKPGIISSKRIIFLKNKQKLLLVD